MESIFTSCVAEARSAPIVRSGARPGTPRRTRTAGEWCGGDGRFPRMRGLKTSASPELVHRWRGDLPGGAGTLTFRPLALATASGDPEKGMHLVKDPRPGDRAGRRDNGGLRATCELPHATSDVLMLANQRRTIWGSRSATWPDVRSETSPCSALTGGCPETRRLWGNWADAGVHGAVYVRPSARRKQARGHPAAWRCSVRWARVSSIPREPPSTDARRGVRRVAVDHGSADGGPR